MCTDLFQDIPIIFFLMSMSVYRTIFQILNLLLEQFNKSQYQHYAI